MAVNLHPAATTLPFKPGAKASPDTVFVTRELDGKENWGALEHLDIGTDKIAPGSPLNAQFFGAGNPYGAVNLLDRQDGVALSDVVLHSKNADGVLGHDEMFVAGDPLIGGKGNGFAAVDIAPAKGFVTMLKDGEFDPTTGAPIGRGITANALVEEINPSGDVAYTQYGFVIDDDNGQTYTAEVRHGKVLITLPDGNVKDLRPPEELIIGDANDPVAKFSYGELPGQGEPRLIVNYYEKPSQATIDKLVAEGADPHEAANLRTTTTATFGWRVPDGVGDAARFPVGTDFDALDVTVSGTKTYYDSHWIEGEAKHIQTHNPPPPPPPQHPVAPKQVGSLFGDPYIGDPDGTNGDPFVKNLEIQEPGTYNVLTDEDLDLRATIEKMKTGNPNLSVVKETGLTISGQQVYINASGTVVVDGDIAIPPGQQFTLNDGSVLINQGASILINTSDAHEYNFRFDTQARYKGGDEHINTIIHSKHDGVLTDNIAPTGLIGEGYDEGDEVRTQFNNPVSDYKRDGLFNSTTTPSVPPAPPAQPTPPAPQPPAAPDPMAGVVQALKGLGLPDNILQVILQLLNAK